MDVTDAAPQFSAVASVEVLTGDGIYPCSVGSRRVLVCRHAGQWYAISAVCTHAGASLESGRLARGRIHCPLHGAAFDLATGAALSPPASRGLATFPIRIIDGRIEVAA